MEIPAHILDAVQTSEATLSVNGADTSKSSMRKPSNTNLTIQSTVSSLGDDASQKSDLDDHEHGYQTDVTSAPSSEACGDDMHTEEVEDFRDREYPQLKGKTYLDHGGTTLYARSLVEDFSHDMISNLYGNPHSASTPSAIAGHRVDEIREKALRFFKADPEEWDLVFVSNATAAIKMVIECFKDYAGSTNTPIWYGYHKDAHTSLVGIREATKMHRCFNSDDEVDTWINSGGFGGPRARQLGLFAYPGQSNMTGRRLPLNWGGRIRKNFHKAATYTLLDAAALASTAPLDFSDVEMSPDFVALSFYKIFGFPNIGALLVRKQSSHVLYSRKFFGGGTVDMVIAVNDTWHAKKDTSVHDRLEDGTLPFHSIFALDHAINVHKRLYGPNPMKFISHHTAQLGKMLYDGLSSMKHSNGAPLALIYGDENSVYGDPTLQGATVAFNVLRADGTTVGYEEVEQAADQRQIYVRSGSLCNPGGVATYLQWSPAEMRAAYAAGHRCSNPTQVVMGKATGVVRVSLGAMNTAADIRILFNFLTEHYLEGKAGQGAPTKLKTQPSQNRLTSCATCGNCSKPGSPQTPGTPGMAPLQTYGLQAPATDGKPQVSPVDVNGSDKASIPERPRFVPGDYIKRHKPWEDEMRKQQANVQVGEVKSNADDTTRANGTPSVKARKFGRSVVNLLRTKSHAPEGEKTTTTSNYYSRTPPMPTTPLPPDTRGDMKLASAHSHRSNPEGLARAV